MIIFEITINELREIDLIKIKLYDNLINYLSKEKGVSVKGTSSLFMLRNIEIKTLNLYIAYGDGELKVDKVVSGK